MKKLFLCSLMLYCFLRSFQAFDGCFVDGQISPFTLPKIGFFYSDLLNDCFRDAFFKIFPVTFIGQTFWVAAFLLAILELRLPTVKPIKGLSITGTSKENKPFNPFASSLTQRTDILDLVFFHFLHL